MNDRKIRACPFCGAKPKVWRWGLGHTVIECSNYDVDTHRVYMQGDSEDEVVNAWNRRMTDDTGDSDKDNG